MRVEFRKAIQPKETRALMAFDRLVFPPSDRFDADYWKQCEAWWMFVGGVKAGCCAFEKNYIATTGILPKFRRQGLGSLMKTWQIARARRKKYTCLIAHVRAGNAASLRLNEKFGFRIARRLAAWYRDPEEDGLVMRLDLP